MVDGREDAYVQLFFLVQMFVAEEVVVEVVAVVVVAASVGWRRVSRREGEPSDKLVLAAFSL